MKTPITKDALRHHWNYSWWKYLMLVVCAIFGWNLIYTTTAYRPPEEKKVVLLAAFLGEQEALNAYMEDIRVNEMPDMEQMDSMLMFMDETYGPMQLSTYIAAGEGDIYVLDKDNFQSYAASGAFLPLEEIEGLQAYCEAHGMDLSKGWHVNTETGEKHLYGLPLKDLPGLQKYLYTTGDNYVSVIVNNMNNDNVVKFLNIMLRDMVSPSTPTDLATPTTLATVTDTAN